MGAGLLRQRAMLAASGSDRCWIAFIPQMNGTTVQLAISSRGSPLFSSVSMFDIFVHTRPDEETALKSFLKQSKQLWCANTLKM